MSSSSLKRLAFALALTGMVGTISVLAAPKVASKGNKPTTSKSVSQKPSASAPKAPKVTKSPTTNTPKGVTKGGPLTNALQPTTPTRDAGDVTDATTQVTLDAQGFVPSGYAGVVVRNVPGPTLQITSPEADASDGPVLSNERPAPGGGMMADVHFPREVETLDNLVPREKVTQDEQVTPEKLTAEQVAAKKSSSQAIEAQRVTGWAKPTQSAALKPAKKADPKKAASKAPAKR